jgi:hypothetical protein
MRHYRDQFPIGACNGLTRLQLTAVLPIPELWKDGAVTVIWKRVRWDLRKYGVLANIALKFLGTAELALRIGLSVKIWRHAADWIVTGGAIVFILVLFVSLTESRTSGGCTSFKVGCILPL